MHRRELDYGPNTLGDSQYLPHCLGNNLHAIMVFLSEFPALLRVLLAKNARFPPEIYYLMYHGRREFGMTLDGQDVDVQK